jgi:hypothetical protein
VTLCNLENGDCELDEKSMKIFSKIGLVDENK